MLSPTAQVLSLTASPPAFDSGNMLLGIVGVIVVIVGAYYATWLLARRTGKMQQGRVVQIVDRFAVGKDKMFCLITMGDKLYLIGLSEGAVTVIDTLEGEAAEDIRAACEAAQQGNLITRGAGFLAGRARGRKFDKQLDQARRQLGEEAEDEAPLAFAREEDDIDAMLRQIAARKRRRDTDGEGGDGL